jgi:type II secretory pathway pseudopilin PulG
VPEFEFHDNNQTGTMMRERRDVGETLIEIVLAILIVGFTVTALLASLATTGNAANAQRRSVQADAVMRNYAEVIKAAAQHCAVGVDDFSSFIAGYTQVINFHVVASPTTCPAGTTAQKVTLTIDSPGSYKPMEIKVRTP